MIEPYMTIEQAHEAGWRAPEALYFTTFMNAVNTEVVEMTGGYGIDCFPDWDWAAAFESGQSVVEVATQFLEEMEA
jgi:hypothetical protein